MVPTRECRTEKGIVESDRIDALHGRIFQKIWIDIEEHWHVHGLPLVQSLLLEAKALNLAKVRRNLCRRNTVGCDSNDVLILTLICRSVESQCCFSRQNSHFSLLRSELPRQDIRCRSSKCDSQSSGRRYRSQLRCYGLLIIGAGMCSRFDRLTSPARLLAYGLV